MSLFLIKRRDSKHFQAGHTKLDLEHAERLAKEKARAYIKNDKKLERHQPDSGQLGINSQLEGASDHHALNSGAGDLGESARPSKKRKADILSSSHDETAPDCSGSTDWNNHTSDDSSSTREGVKRPVVRKS